MKKINVIKRISFIAVFGALTSVLYCFVKFNLPIFPGFLDINISMIPVIICAFMLGPWDAAACVLIRFVIKLMVGSSTAYVGEIADLILGLVPAISAGLIYKYYKGKFSEGLAFISVIVTWSITGVLVNYFLNIPFYLEFFFDGAWEPLIGMVEPAVNLISFGAVGTITKENFMLWYLLLGVVPFNLFLSLIVIGVTLPVHKRLRVLYDQIGMNRCNNINLDTDCPQKDNK